MSTQNRIDELEIKIAHLEQQNEELNEVLQAQYDKIDMIETRLKRLHAKVDERGSGQDTPVDKPPHW